MRKRVLYGVANYEEFFSRSMKIFIARPFMSCAAGIFPAGLPGMWNDPIHGAEQIWSLWANTMKSLQEYEY